MMKMNKNLFIVRNHLKKLKIMMIKNLFIGIQKDLLKMIQKNLFIVNQVEEKSSNILIRTEVRNIYNKLK